MNTTCSTPSINSVNVAEGSWIDLMLDQVGVWLGLHKTNWAIPMPTTFWEDTGDVVVVSPTPVRGGADMTRTNAI